MKFVFEAGPGLFTTRFWKWNGDEDMSFCDSIETLWHIPKKATKVTVIVTRNKPKDDEGAIHFRYDPANERLGVVDTPDHNLWGLGDPHHSGYRVPDWMAGRIFKANNLTDFWAVCEHE